MKKWFSRAVLSIAIVCVQAFAAWAVPVTTHPYLGITRITDSFGLAPPIN